MLGVRTIAPAPAGAQAVAGQHDAAAAVAISTVASRAGAARCTVAPARPGGDRVAVAAERRPAPARDTGAHLDRRRERRRPATPAAARRRPARRPSCACRRRCAARGRRPARRRTRPGAACASSGVASRSSSATTAARRRGSPSPPRPCGSRAAAGTAPRPRRSASPPARTSACTVPAAGTTPWPAGRSATRGSPAQPAQHRVHRLDQCGWSIDSASTPRHRPECGSVPNQHIRLPPHPTARRRAARTSPTGSPHPAGGRSRSCPGPSTPGTPRNAGRSPARAQLPGERRIRPAVAQRGAPRRTTPSPTGAGHRRTGPRSSRERARTGPAAGRPATPAWRSPFRYARTVLRSRPEMAGDRRDRPAPPAQRMRFHVFSHVSIRAPRSPDVTPRRSRRNPSRRAQHTRDGRPTWGS